MYHINQNDMDLEHYKLNLDILNIILMYKKFSYSKLFL